MGNTWVGAVYAIGNTAEGREFRAYPSCMINQIGFWAKLVGTIIPNSTALLGREYDKFKFYKKLIGIWDCYKSRSSS